MRSGLGKRADPEARQTAGSLWIGQVIKGRQKEICVPKIAAFVRVWVSPLAPMLTVWSRGEQLAANW